MKKILIISILLLTLSFSELTYAASSLSLDPLMGEITAQGQTIDIIVDSGGQQIDGIELTLEYEGDLSFVGFASGDINDCEVDGLEREAYDDIFLYCFIMSQPYTGTSGVFASLDFVATGENGGTITVTGAVLGSEVIEIGPSGTYTTTILGTEPTTTALPQTSLVNTVVFFVGAFLVLFSFLFFPNKISSQKGERMIKKLKE